MIKDKIRFIEADHCPVKTDVGWIVPRIDTFTAKGHSVTTQELITHLHKIGLSDNQFTVYGHGWGRQGSTPLKRVIFRDYEAYLMALIAMT